MKNKKILLIILGFFFIFGIFGIQKIIAANGLYILGIQLLPALDISRFSSYTIQSEISGNIISGTVSLEGINGDGTGCRNYLASGTCISNNDLIRPLIFSGGNTRVQTGVRPDHIYPQIFFMDNATNRDNAKSNNTISLNNYEILHFKNPFTMEGNMSFFIELNIAPRSTASSVNMDIYLVKKNKTISFFQNNWLNNTGVEKIASYTRLSISDHIHSSNSSHYLVTLTTNSDGTIGTKNLDINGDFRVVASANTSTPSKGRYLKYLPSNLCKNTNGRYVGNPTSRNTSAQAGCPDTHIHIARRDDPIKDGMKATLNISYLSGAQTLQTSGSQVFYFNELPNLVPNATSFYSPTLGNYSGNINIYRNPSSDANNDIINYSLYLLDSTGTEISNVATGISTTGYSLNSTTILDGTYGLKGKACDAELCSTFTLESNFQIDNTSPILTEVSPISTFTNQTSPSYIFNTNEAGKINYSGNCSSTNITGTIGNNLITFSTLTEGTYSNCKIQITDNVGNNSNRLTIDTFTIYNTSPTANIVYNITGTTNQNVTATITGFNRTTTGINATVHTFTGNGSFIFTFNDLAGNTGSTTATVNWIDKESPIITLIGTTSLNLYLNSNYNEQGSTWTDNSDGNGVILSHTSGTLNTGVAGIYTLEYGYTDTANNYGMAQRTINVLNSTGVIINIIGSNPYYVEYGSSYNEQGANRSDPIDGSGSVSNSNTTSNVNTGSLGSYAVEYTYVNNAGLTGTLSRTVIVQDKIEPSIILNGSSTIYIEYGSSYSEQGATRSDLYDGSGIVNDIIGSVNTGNIGSYIVTYSKIDSSGNTGSTNRTVIVQDNIKPNAMLSSTNTNPTNSKIYMTAQFSEYITGFSVEDITISNGFISNFTKIDGDTYTFEVAPTYQGSEVISINSSKYQDLANNSNTSISSFTIEYDTISPTASDIIYDITEPTNQNITATIEGFNENYTGLNATSHTFTENGSFTFTFTDLAGNTGSSTATVNRIDKTKPTADISYNITGSTNQDIIATLADESETILGTTSHTFTENGSYIFNFTDLAGNTGSSTATVNRIDKTKPTGTIEYSPNTSTYGDVIVTITLSKTGTITNNGGNLSYTFTGNGSFTFQFSDLVGNTGSTTATVNRIDKENVVNVRNSDSAEIQTTGKVIFIGGNETGVVFSRAGTIIVNENNGEGEIEINTDGLTILASGDRNMILLAPTEIGILEFEIAEFGEPGVPLETESHTTREILNTVKVGSTGSQLIATGGDNFKIIFKVNSGVVGETLKVYRSNDGYNRETNYPDTTCTLDSNKLCTFYTNHLSYFATIKEEITEDNTGNNNQGGGIILIKDICPNGDFSPSYYDKICGKQINEGKKESEFEQAYGFAYENKITSKKTQSNAEMEGLLLRIDLAKMLVNYSLNILGKAIDNTKLCEFNDLEKISNGSQKYAINSCQLGLMGQNTNNEFNPYGKITRAEFGTILSRLLRGEKHNKSGINRYNDHLKALKEKEIMKQIDIPTMLELRGYVMLMLMRAKDF